MAQSMTQRQPGVVDQVGNGNGGGPVDTPIALSSVRVAAPPQCKCQGAGNSLRRLTIDQHIAHYCEEAVDGLQQGGMLVDQGADVNVGVVQHGDSLGHQLESSSHNICIPCVPVL